MSVWWPEEVSPFAANIPLCGQKADKRKRLTIAFLKPLEYSMGSGCMNTSTYTQECKVDKIFFQSLIILEGTQPNQQETTTANGVFEGIGHSKSV
jgi:hypothetical protein